MNLDEVTFYQNENKIYSGDCRDIMMDILAGVRDLPGLTD